jgi:hypothetical protein
MAIVSSGNQFNHPTKERLLESIPKLKQDLMACSALPTSQNRSDEEIERMSFNELRLYHGILLGFWRLYNFGKFY